MSYTEEPLAPGTVSGDHRKLSSLAEKLEFYSLEK